MDVFDSSLSYQQGVLNLVSSSPLLLSSTCALAARQLDLISSARSWTAVAERFYGESLRLLRSSLDSSVLNLEHALVATILLSSYELLAFPGDDYHRHFRGAKSFVELLEAYNSLEQMTRASFWIYARHEVGEAMNLEQPTMQDPLLWPKPDVGSTSAADVDAYCNDALRLCGKVIYLTYSTNRNRRGKKWAKQWLDLRLDWSDWLHGCPQVLFGSVYDDNGSRRFWFSRPSFAAALSFYHVCQIFLLRNCPDNIPQSGEQ